MHDGTENGLVTPRLFLDRVTRKDSDLDLDKYIRVRFVMFKKVFWIPVDSHDLEIVR